MKGTNEIFIKVNYKNIGELNSFIYDKTSGVNKNKDRYVMCAGKYDKNGWTIVFKAKSVMEAEELVEMNSRKRNALMSSNFMSEEKVSIPCFM